MLAALLLLGVLPFAAMPFFEGGTLADGPERPADDDGPGDPADTGGPGDLLDDVAEPAQEDDAPEGESYQFAADAQEATLYAFEPGLDSVDIDLTGAAGDITYDMAQGAEGAVLSIALGGDGVLTLHFEGLTEVPSGDIALTLTDDDTDEPFTLALSDAALLLDEPLEGVLDPVDPEEPGEPGPVDPVPALEPVDPEEPDEPGPVTDDPVLDPVDPDDSFGPEGDLTLHELLLRDGAGLHGLGAALGTAASAGVVDTVLTGGDDSLAVPQAGANNAGGATLTMSEGTPVLDGGGAIQVVDAGAGDDIVTTTGGAAYVFGGAGNDTLSAAEGGVALYGGGGQDVLDATAAEGAVFLDGGGGDDALTGGAGNDVLEGGEHLPGMTGDDTIAGGAGDDTIRGGLGADTLAGGAGNDVIDHLGLAEENEIAEHRAFAWHDDDGERDVLSGGAGDDTLIAGDGDQASGGAASDLFHLYHAGGNPVVILDFAVGEDFLRVTLEPVAGDGDLPEMEVRPSADGQDAEVRVDGDLVAILRGAPGASVSDVYAEIAQDVFPAG